MLFSFFSIYLLHGRHQQSSRALQELRSASFEFGDVEGIAKGIFIPIIRIGVSVFESSFFEQEQGSYLTRLELCNKTLSIHFDVYTGTPGGVGETLPTFHFWWEKPVTQSANQLVVKTIEWRATYNLWRFAYAAMIAYESHVRHTGENRRCPSSLFTAVSLVKLTNYWNISFYTYPKIDIPYIPLHSTLKVLFQRE